MINYIPLVSVPEVPAGAAEKAKSKQELSRNEHFAAVKHEGDWSFFLITRARQYCNFIA